MFFLYSCMTIHCTNDYEDGAASGPGAAGLDSCVLESLSVAICDDAAAGSALSCMRVSLAGALVAATAGSVDGSVAGSDAVGVVVVVVAVDIFASTLVGPAVSEELLRWTGVSEETCACDASEGAS